MPEKLLAAVWAYFDAGGPLLGRPWPIVYREDEQARVAALRSFGVEAFTAMLYPHKPGMAHSLNEWAADFAARTPDCLHTATFFAEPSAAADVRRALGQGARVFKCHLQVGDFDPNDPLLDEAWGLLADAAGAGGHALRLRPGARPVHRARAGRPAARPLPQAPPGGGAPGHAGVHGVPRPRRAQRPRHARHHDVVHAVGREGGAPFPADGLPRLRDLGDRVLFGTDFPNIPHSYADALEALEMTGLGTPWLRAVCHDNAARLFSR